MGAIIHPQIASTHRLVRYQEGSKLAGIIYIHCISDERFTGMSVCNFRMFRELCGESSLRYSDLRSQIHSTACANQHHPSPLTRDFPLPCTLVFLGGDLVVYMVVFR